MSRRNPFLTLADTRYVPSPKKIGETKNIQFYAIQRKCSATELHAWLMVIRVPIYMNFIISFILWLMLHLHLNGCVSFLGRQNGGIHRCLFSFFSNSQDINGLHDPVLPHWSVNCIYLTQQFFAMDRCHLVKVTLHLLEKAEWKISLVSHQL